MNIKEETRKDLTLSKVLKYSETGWPESTLGDPDLVSYARRKDQLSIQSGCILWGVRVIVPTNLRKAVMSELHSDHCGASRMKELARSYVWWPNMDKDLETLVNSCQLCLENRAMPPKADLHPWEWPEKPWHRIHIDHAGPVDGHYFLIIVDAHSKWVDIHKVSNTSTKETIKWLSHSFSMCGLPVSLVSDNAPCFTSQEFQDFMKNCGVKHVTSAVYHPSTNGLAERMVQTFKRALKRSEESLQLTLDRFLFNYRMTPHTTTGVAPAELMFGRKLRCRLDLLWPTLSEKVAAKQQQQRKNHAKFPRKVVINSDDKVMIRNYSQRGARWSPATVDCKTGPLSYRCQLDSGGMVRRHQDQIHLRSESPPPPLKPVTSLPVTNQPELVDLPLSRTEQNVREPCIVPVAPTSVTQSSEIIQDTCLPRRSTRLRKPVDRLNL